MIFIWISVGFPMGDFHDISMIFLWDYHGMSIVSKLKSIDQLITLITFYSGGGPDTNQHPTLVGFL